MRRRTSVSDSTMAEVVRQGNYGASNRSPACSLPLRKHGRKFCGSRGTAQDAIEWFGEEAREQEAWAPLVLNRRTDHVPPSAFG